MLNAQLVSRERVIPALARACSPRDFPLSRPTISQCLFEFLACIWRLLKDKQRYANEYLILSHCGPEACRSSASDRAAHLQETAGCIASAGDAAKLDHDRSSVFVRARARAGTNTSVMLVPRARAHRGGISSLSRGRVVSAWSL